MRKILSVIGICAASAALLQAQPQTQSASVVEQAVGPMTEPVVSPPAAASSAAILKIKKTDSASASENTAMMSSTASLAAINIPDLERQVKLLKTLVDVSSDSKLETEGVNKVQSIVEDELKAMKFSVEEIPSPDTLLKSGKLLVASYPGKSLQNITILAHADTVFPAFTGFAKFERINDEEAGGPGVIDDKGGLVVALEALRIYLKNNPEPPYSIRFVVSPSEEIGSTGFLNIFDEYAKTSIAVFGMEPALDDGDIVNSRRGDRWYDVKVTGREAHSGRDHEKGVNACVELAMKIQKLQALTNYKQGISVSTGAMRGGKDKYAIVCGDANAKIDVRFSDLKNRERVLKKVEDILRAQYVKAASDGARATTEFKIVDDPHPFPSDPENKTLTTLYIKSIAQIEGKKITAKRSGGSSDINFFYHPGMVMLDGLGAVGSGMHTMDEKIQLRSLQTRAQALAKLLDAASL